MGRMVGAESSSATREVALMDTTGDAFPAPNLIWTGGDSSAGPATPGIAGTRDVRV